MHKHLAFLLAAAVVCSAAPALSQSTGEAKRVAKPASVAHTPAALALSPEELAVAQYVTVGRFPCEGASFVTVEADAKLPGYFYATVGKQKFHMIPVPTNTGAIRLEDKKTGAVWLQLGTKSMMMNQKLGARLADECLSSAQIAFADNLKKNPVASPLDAGPAGAKP